MVADSGVVADSEEEALEGEAGDLADQGEHHHRCH